MRSRHTPPYTHEYYLTVRPEYDGLSVIDYFAGRFPFRERNYWFTLIETGEITVNGQTCAPSQILRAGDLTYTVRHDVTEPDVNDDYKILYNQNGLFIINKPAPLPVHAAGRYNKNTLLSILREQHPGTTFHTIHRLDLWTTGVLILATEPEIARHIHIQVEKKQLKKTYGVLAKGDFGNHPFTIDVPVGRKSGSHRGFGPEVTESKPCVTEFTPLCKQGDITLLKAIPITGRTNQIRVHIQAAGGHVLNDPLYSNSPVSENEIDFMGLHCREMRIILPSGEELTVTAPWPEGFLRTVGEDVLREFEWVLRSDVRPTQSSLFTTE